jgi:hypothetical protein
MVLFTCKKASKTNSIGNLARLCLLPVCFLFLFIYLFFIIMLLMDCLVQMLLSRHLNPVFATGAFVIPTSLYFLLKVITDATLKFSLAC